MLKNSNDFKWKEKANEKIKGSDFLLSDKSIHEIQQKLAPMGRLKHKSQILLYPLLTFLKEVKVALEVLMNWDKFISVAPYENQLIKVSTEQNRTRGYNNKIEIEKFKKNSIQCENLCVTN
ncbi:CLUMA_CG013025, isoform A [Clunio marinus]|uniref:CLUMA_CG013025, isoform A n=1 Tax=Clunio marinus TaxID=568069 RepID=A0A1J1IHC6_9DIPT|nr:CLUMA_CG013025, isoform A [Clunio marinus]